MKLIHSTLTSAGQTTIPVQVRKALGIKPRQQLVYEIREDGVLLRTDKTGLMSLAGSLRSKKGALSLKDQDAAAEHEAVRAARK